MKTRIRKLNIHLCIQLLMLICAVAIDQISKFIITKVFPEPNPDENIVLIKGVLEFTYIRNSGASFGIFQDRMFLFYIITIAVLIIIAFFMVRINISLRRYYKLCEGSPELYKKRTNRGMIYLGYILCALAAGALGNFIDRVRLGYVVDFIDVLIFKTPSFDGGFHLESFPIFNVADIFVTVSAVLLLIFIIVFKEDKNFSLFKNKNKKAEQKTSQQ